MATHEQIASIAYRLWQQRGCPRGSPEVDWERALQMLEDSPGDADGRPWFASDDDKPDGGRGREGGAVPEGAHPSARPSGRADARKARVEKVMQDEALARARSELASGEYDMQG